MCDILDKLKGGDRRSIGRVPEVIQDIGDDPSLFAQLFSGLLNDDPLVRMRAADAVEKISVEHREYLQTFKKTLLNRIAVIEQKEIHWHLAQMLPRLDLDQHERSRAAEILIGFLEDDSKIVKTFSLQALFDLAVEDERLQPLVTRTLQDMVGSDSPAVRNRAEKLIVRLNR